MKKQWISVKCGLSRDPEHRRVMGEGIWLFLHMLDTADWDTGISADWKDEAAAEDMGMPVRTLREHRRKLAEAGYITCVQKQYTQDIVIHNWTNPREYNGKVYNKKQSDKETSPSDGQGYTQGYTQGNSKDVTPTYDSNIKESNSILSEKEIEQANKKVDYILANNSNPTLLREKPAIDAFESAFGITRPWAWYPAKTTDERTWKDLRGYLVELYEADPECFTKYVTWTRVPYAKGTMTALGIKRNPQDFPDSWSCFLASSSMYSQKESKEFGL